MPRVSDRKLDPDLQNQILQLFYEGVGELSPKGARKVLKALLTPEERLMVAKRIAAMLLLKGGYSYKDLDKVLRIVPATTVKIKKQVRANQQIMRDFAGLIETNPICEDFYKTAKDLKQQKSGL